MSKSPLSKPTAELLEILNSAQHTDTLETYLDDLAKGHGSFADYYTALPAVRALSPRTLIARSGIERTYFYQLVNGRRRPGRDKIITLCLAARLDLTATQRGLEIAQAGVLYPKNRRDAILIFAVRNHLNALEVNDLLDQFGETLLG